MRAPDSAAGSAPAAIGVDFDQLARISRDLRQLAAQVADRDSILHGQLGDPDLLLALWRAEQDWATHRRRLRSLLEGAAAAVESSLAGYQAIEEQIARAAR